MTGYDFHPEATLTMLCGHADMLVEKFWSKICAVLPSQRVASNIKASKQHRIAQWRKNWTLQIVRQVHLAARSIVEPQPHDVVTYVSRLDNM